MHIKRIKYIRSIAVFVALAVMLAVVLTGINSEKTTGNAASLKHIDEIIAEGGTFNILEIVPDKNAASFGYYIDGQEPISSAYFDTYSDGTTLLSGWKATLAKMTSPGDRTGFVNEHFGQLAKKGILGNSSTTPLKYTYYDETRTSYYDETYLADDPQNWSTLRLAGPESVTWNGTLTPTDNAAFRADYAYSPVSDGTGAYVQNVSHFTYTSAAPNPADSNTYFYNPVFTLITLE